MMNLVYYQPGSLVADGTSPGKNRLYQHASLIPVAPQSTTSSVTSRRNGSASPISGMSNSRA